MKPSIPRPRLFSRAAQGLAFLLAVVASLQAVAQEQSAKPVAVVSFAGYDSLMSDVDFIGNLAGQPQASQMVEQQLMAMTNNQGLAGLDKSKPIGLIVNHDGMNFGGALCLPVTDFDALLQVAGAAGVTANDMGDGIKQLMTPMMPMVAKSSGGWAFISMSQPMLESVPADPASLLSPLASDYDLAIQLNIQNIPEAYRQMGIDMMTEGARQGMQKLPGESDADFAERQSQLTAQMEEVKRSFEEMETVAFGISLDGQQGRALMDVVYTAMPDTKLAQQIAESSEPTTDYAGFYQPDAAMMMSLAGKTTEADQAQLDQMVEQLRNQARKAIDEEADLPNDEAREIMKSAFDDFIDAMQATLKAGKMDGGAVLNLAPDAVTFVAGGFIGDPAKVESGIKKIAELAKQEEEFPGVSWDSATHGDVTFHTMNFPVPEDKEEPRQMFGDTVDVAVGIGKQSVYFALGRNCMDAVKQVIDVSAQNQGKAIPPMEMTVSLTQIMEMAATYADEEERPQLQMIADMLARDARGADHVRIIVQPVPQGLRTRIEAEEGVLKAMGMAATLWQQ